jgi:hypothetical protein
MPNALCGIEGMGMKTAMKKMSIDDNYSEVVKREYLKKYPTDGFERAQRTYQMVRLLRTSNNDYANAEAKAEVKYLIENSEEYLQPVINDLESLFN